MTNLPDDIEAAYKFLTSRGTVDTRRLVVVGHSLGGYHALRLAADSIRGFGVEFRGAVALCPLVGSDVVGVPLGMDYAKDFANFLNGAKPEDLQMQWSDLLPTKDIVGALPGGGAGNRMPLLIITGDADPLFSPSYYRHHLIPALESRSQFDFDWMRLRHGDHALCRYRRKVVEKVVKHCMNCVGLKRGLRQDLEIALMGLSALLDVVPSLTIVAALTGFIAGRFNAYKEAHEVKGKAATRKRASWF